MPSDTREKSTSVLFLLNHVTFNVATITKETRANKNCNFCLKLKRKTQQSNSEKLNMVLCCCYYCCVVDFEQILLLFELHTSNFKNVFLLMG